jgi:hypothetical protein
MRIKKDGLYHPFSLKPNLFSMKKTKLIITSSCWKQMYAELLLRHINRR